MLIIAHALKELRFGQLMEVYSQSNSEACNGNLLQAEQDFYAYLRESFFCDPKAFYAVWERDGTYKAALRMEPYKDGYLLEALETAPSARRKGYATMLVKEVLNWQAEQGSTAVYSHVKKVNEASLAVHRACGFVEILDHAVYIDGSVLRDSVTLCYQVNKK